VAINFTSVLTTGQSKARTSQARFPICWELYMILRAKLSVTRASFPAGGKGVREERVSERRKGCQVPFPGRHGFLTVFSNPNCATALLAHPSDPYGLLLFIACRIFSTSSLGCERLSHSRYLPGSGTGHGLSNPFWLSFPYSQA